VIDIFGKASLKRISKTGNRCPKNDLGYPSGESSPPVAHSDMDQS